MKLEWQESQLPIREIKINTGKKVVDFQRHGDLFPRRNIRMILSGPSGKKIIFLLSQTFIT